jgi:hypothetical protein
MKTHLDASYLGLVCSVFNCREEKIEIESSVRVGEILRLPTEKHNTSFAPGVAKDSGGLRSLSMIVNSRDIFQIGGKNEWQK